MRVRRCLILIPATLALLVPERPGKAAEQPKGGAAVEFKLTSQAFNDGAAIPVKYTGDGANGSPPLVWTEPPTGATKREVLAKIEGHVLATAKLMGTYRR